MTRDQVLHLKHNAFGDLNGRSNQNYILVTHIYKVKFHWGKITELAANIIVESMYAQFDFDGKEYLLLEVFINHKKNSSALSVNDQKLVVKVPETLRKSTTGWDICYEWKDGSISWRSYPILRSASNPGCQTYCSPVMSQPLTGEFPTS